MKEGILKYLYSYKNKNKMSNYIPNKVSILEDNVVVGSSNNTLNTKIYQNDNITLFLKEQVKTNNYVDCFSFKDNLFYITCSQGVSYLLNIEDTKFDFEQEKLIIQISNIWRAKWKGDSIEEGRCYLTIASSNFCIGGIKTIIKKKYDNNSVNNSEGYITDMNINIDYEEDSITKFLNLTPIYIQNFNNEQQEINELKSRFNIIWNSNYYTFGVPDGQPVVYKIDFDKIGNNYNIGFFSQKILSKSTLDITFSRINSEGNLVKKTFNYPIEFNFKNQLIQICNNNLKNTLDFVISEETPKLQFVIWCPDMSYFNYSINSIQDSLVKPEITDFGYSYKLFTFTFNLDNYEGNENFYYILNCFYNQGEVSDNQVFTINFSVSKKI